MSNQKERLVSPSGIAKYPRLNTPDTKWKEAGQYKVTLVLDEEEPKVAKFLAYIRSLEKAVKAEFSHDPKKSKYALNSIIRPHTDDEGNEVDGKVEITFKTTATGVNKKGEAWERKVRMFDAKGHPTEAKVGTGSTLKVSFTLGQNYANPSSKSVGLTVYLEAVQILDLVEFRGEADAGDYGFGEEEGFEAEGSEFAGSSEEDEKQEPEAEEEAEQEAEEEEQEPEAEEEAPAPKKTAKPAPKPVAKPAPAKAPVKKGRGNF